MHQTPTERLSELEGLQILVDQCLSLESHDELLVLYDEAFLSFLPLLNAAALRRDWNITRLFIPTADQLQMVARARGARDETAVALNRVTKEALLTATAVLNVLNGSLETSVVRGTIIDCPRSQDCRFAHVPGLDKHVLDVLRITPIADVQRSAEALAWAFGESSAAELVTVDHRKREHVLRIGLGGWDSEPMMSPGIIAKGSWGNVPPGETFCCPDPAVVNGAVCINGSLPGYCLKPEDDVVLWFEQGKLLRWEGAPEPCTYLERERERAGQRRDENWNTFAELGVGLNPVIKALTGNSLYDEKAYGTVHIAIGANDTFGHPIQSAIHADLVTRAPTLSFDGHTIMHRGELRLADIEQRRASVTYEPLYHRPLQTVFLREGRIHVEGDSVRRVLARAHRVGHVAIAPPDMHRALAHAVVKLSEQGDVRVADFVRAYPGFEGVDTSTLLGVLDHYRVLGFGR